ncbi:MAG: asparagine--tRNA ligase [Clostridiales bacterium]
MKITTLNNLFTHGENYLDTVVTLGGWVKTIRNSKSLGFIELNDGTYFNNIQIIFEENKIDNFSDIAAQNVGAALVITGKFVKSPNKKQAFEVQSEKIEVEGTSSPQYPLQKKRHTLEYLRTIQHLRPRTNTLAATFRVRSAASFAIHQFFNNEGFIYAHTPIITASDCEGAGEMFRVSTLNPNNLPQKNGAVDYSADFFGKPTGLTVSGQLEGEAMALAFSKIYTFGPTFRAENSNTPRHAGEFWMVEPEIAFGDLTDDMDLAEKMIKNVIKEVLKTCPQEMEFFNAFYDTGLLERLNNIISADFVRISYTKAIELLEKAEVEFEYPVAWGMDLQTEHERYLTEKVYEKPLFVTDYPKEIKAFYMRLNDDGKTVAAMDLLVPNVGEIIGGSQREERLTLLTQRLAELNIKEDEYWWYLELRKYGGTRHAGFGLGFERLIMYITGMKNIRDVIPFPRTTGQAEF